MHTVIFKNKPRIVATGSIAGPKECEGVVGKYVDKGIYYYTTYENSQVCAVDMHKEDLDGNKLVSYPLDKTLAIQYQN